MVISHRWVIRQLSGDLATGHLTKSSGRKGHNSRSQETYLGRNPSEVIPESSVIASCSNLKTGQDSRSSRQSVIFQPSIITWGHRSHHASHHTKSPHHRVIRWSRNKVIISKRSSWSLRSHHTRSPKAKKAYYARPSRRSGKVTSGQVRSVSHPQVSIITFHLQNLHVFL